MKKALIGFGGCGENLIETLAGNDRDFLLTALVRSEERGNRDFGKDNIVDLHSPSRLEFLAQKLEGIDACFMVGGLGGGACQYMLELGRELLRKGIWTAALTTFPFRFEGLAEKAEQNRDELEKILDAILVFENDRLPEGEHRKTSLAAMLKASVREMRFCLETMTAQCFDTADLRKCLKGRLYYGIGHSEENLLQAARKAADAIGKNFPPDFRPASGMMAFYGNDMEILGVAAGELRRLLDGDRISWLVSLERPLQDDRECVTLLACGGATGNTSPAGQA